MKTIHQSVTEIDEARSAYFSRNPDRPEGRVQTRTRKFPEIKKAQSRLRTAAWRSENDSIKRPEAYHCSMQFLASMLTVIRQAGHEGLEDFRETEQAFQHALAALELRGYDKAQVRIVFKRLMRRVA